MAASEQAHIAWVGLSLVRHLGGKTLDALLARFGTADTILEATSAELQQVNGVGTKTAAAIRQIDPDRVARRLTRWQQQGVQVITPDHAQYPALLRELADYPPTLFVRGAFHPAAWETPLPLSEPVSRSQTHAGLHSVWRRVWQVQAIPLSAGWPSAWMQPHTGAH